MRHQKMISLDGETLKIAEEIPNFSAWVRAQLLSFNERQNPLQIWAYYCPKCDKEYYAKHKDNFFYCKNWDCKDIGTLTPREVIQ